MRRVLLALIAVAGLATASSGADFTAHSVAPTTFTAAADFNTVAVSIGTVGSPLTGSVALSATASSNRGVANVKFQYAPSGTTDWADICTDATSSYGCSWNTPAIADGTYDVRALATDNAGYSRAAVRTERVVNNYDLSVTLTDPGAMSGSESLTASAAYASNGINYLRIQHRAPGATTWIDVCTGTGNPRTCSLDTTTLPNGDRELRAVVRDGDGRIAQTTPITRTVDNTPPETTPNIPPTGSGQVTVGAEATDTGSGIRSVTFQAYYMGQWMTVCEDTAAPYTCTTDSAGVPDGPYDIRIITVNNAGVSSTGPTSQIVVNNNAPSGTDVVATNGTGTAGRIDSGDTIRLTWTEPMAPASILAGWAGASQAVTVHVRNNGTNDEMRFAGVNLVLSATDLKLGGNFVSADVQFNAMMTRNGNSIDVRLTSSSAGVNTLLNSTMTWRPSPLATDLAGTASTTATVTETSDRDF